jgi:hypothetical protein
MVASVLTDRGAVVDWSAQPIERPVGVLVHGGASLPSLKGNHWLAKASLGAVGCRCLRQVNFRK